MNKPDEKPLTRREKREQLESNQAKLGAKNFNRNQTISGVQKDRSERFENRKMIIRRRKLTGFFVALGISSILIFVFLSQLVVNFSVINAENNSELVKSSDYNTTIEQYYASQPIERITTYLKEENLLNFIQKTHPEVENIQDIKMSGILKFNFALTFRKPVASWTSGDKKLYVDSNGVSFEKNYYSEPDLVVSDESGVRASSGKTIASSVFIGFVGRVISSAESEGLKVTKISIPAQSLRQISIYVDKAPYPAKMLITESAKGQVSNFSKAIQYFSKNNIKPEYVDLRVEGKGYYK